MTNFEPFGLYVHFPYCRQRCSYCDFNAHLQPSEGAAAHADYLRALLADIAQQEERAVTTLFLGGGTPSLLSLEHLQLLMETLKEKFTWAGAFESTIEVNPGTAAEAEFEKYLELGFNRVSLGAQSFHPEHLEAVGRLHGPRDICTSAKTARGAGFRNLSLDLIYGFPEQTLEQWEESLNAALDLQPDHLSVYMLTVEPGTRLQSQLARKEVELPCEEVVSDMDDLACEVLSAAGFFRYEVSNWALPGFLSLHNLIYWQDQPYLGLGCGAVSYMNGWRSERIKAPLFYQKALAEGRSPLVFLERRGNDGAVKDALMMGLRIEDGVSVARLLRNYPGLKVSELHGFFESLPRNWWQVTEEGFRLTRTGWDFHSEVTMQLMRVQFSFS